MEDVLLAHGIGSDRIMVIPDEVTAVDKALRLADPNDLLLIFGDNCPRCWKQIIGFEVVEDSSKQPATTRVERAIVPPPPMSMGLDMNDLEIISDERGVRLARMEDD